MDNSSTQRTNMTPDISASPELRFPTAGFHLPRPSGCENTPDCLCSSCRPRVDGSNHETSCPCPQCKPHDFVFIPCTPEWTPGPFGFPPGPQQQENSNSEAQPSDLSTLEHLPVSFDWPEGSEVPPRLLMLPGRDEEGNATAPVVTKTWGPMKLPTGFIEKCQSIELRNCLTGDKSRRIDPTDAPPIILAKDDAEKGASATDVGPKVEQDRDVVEVTKKGDGSDDASLPGSEKLDSRKEKEGGGHVRWGDLPLPSANPGTTGKPNLKDTKNLPWTNYRDFYNTTHGIEYPTHLGSYNNDWSNEWSYDTAHVPHTCHFSKFAPASYFPFNEKRWSERRLLPPTPPPIEPEPFNDHLYTAATGNDFYAPKLPTYYHYPTPPSPPTLYDYSPPTRYAYPSTPPQTYRDASYRQNTNSGHRFQNSGKYSVHPNHSRSGAQEKFDNVTAIPSKGRGVYNPHTDKWLQLQLLGDGLHEAADKIQTHVMDSCQTDRYGVELQTPFEDGLDCYGKARAGRLYDFEG